MRQLPDTHTAPETFESTLETVKPNAGNGHVSHVDCLVEPSQNDNRLFPRRADHHPSAQNKSATDRLSEYCIVLRFFRIVAEQPVSLGLPLQRQPHILAFPWREWSRNRPCFHPRSASAEVSNGPSRRHARQYGSRALVRLKVSEAI